MKNDEKETVTEQSQFFLIQRDTSNEEVLRLNQKQELRWTEEGFRELPESVENALTPTNLRNYTKVRVAVEDRAIKARVEVVKASDQELEFVSNYRLKTRERRGWHTYWASPGPDFDMRMAMGVYKQIRKHKTDIHGNDAEPDVEAGYENGEVLKLLDGEGKVELIALECPLEYYENTIAGMAQRSQEKFVRAPEDLEKVIEEEVNVRVPSKARMKVIDEDGVRK